MPAGGQVYSSWDCDDPTVGRRGEGGRRPSPGSKPSPHRGYSMELPEFIFLLNKAWDWWKEWRCNYLNNVGVRSVNTHLCEKKVTDCWNYEMLKLVGEMVLDWTIVLQVPRFFIAFFYCFYSIFGYYFFLWRYKGRYKGIVKVLTWIGKFEDGVKERRRRLITLFAASWGPATVMRCWKTKAAQNSAILPKKKKGTPQLYASVSREPRNPETRVLQKRRTFNSQLMELNVSFKSFKCHTIVVIAKQLRNEI